MAYPETRSNAAKKRAICDTDSEKRHKDEQDAAGRLVLEKSPKAIIRAGAGHSIGVSVIEFMWVLDDEQKHPYIRIYSINTSAFPFITYTIW